MERWDFYDSFGYLLCLGSKCLKNEFFFLYLRFEEMSLHLVVGPMWAGKSSYILNKIRRYSAIGWYVCVVTSAIDNRYGESIISSHDGDGYTATAVMNLLPLRDTDIYKNSKAIILDESQFFDDLVNFVLKAVEEDGKHVIAVGLDGDSERRSFGDILKLIPYSDSIEKITSLCSECKDGTAAIFSHRCIQTEEQVAVGGKNMYQPLCRKHYIQKKANPT